MFSQLFGVYLVRENIISQKNLDDILKNQQSTRVRLGTIAVSEGLLTEEEADEINHIQTREDKRFGDIAVERNLLTQEQIESMLQKQGDSFMKFQQQLTDELHLSMAEIETYLSDYQSDFGFTDEEMDALKKDDIDEICALFAYAAKPYVTEITSLVLRNITRFITGNFYIDKIEKVESFAYHCLAGQKISGDHTVYIAFGDDSEEGLTNLASGFAKESYTETSAEVFDAIGEFSNICSGLFASELSRQGVNIDMEPPFVYLNQSVSGRAYLVPIHIEGKLVKLFIAVDSEELVLGKQRHIFQTKKAEGSVVTEESKGTVVIVDDSALIRKMLRQVIEEYGYTVVCEAVNGQEAVEEYRRYQPDLITLDITMPVMDGLEALKQIKEYDENAKVIMITAAGQQQKVIEALKIGAQHFIIKPFRKEEVITSFDGVCKAK